jgi:hypothetical protein
MFEERVVLLLIGEAQRYRCKFCNHLQIGRDKRKVHE